ncbi:hypothetical protein ADK34_17835, partial [Streptomyces viridochromogenes]
MGWSKISVAGSRSPVRAESRLRSSTEVRESNPISFSARSGGGEAENGRGLALDRLQEDPFPLVARHPGHALRERVRVRVGALGGATARRDQSAQHGGHRAVPGPGPQTGEVQLHRQQGGFGGLEGEIEELHALVRRERDHATAGDALVIGIAEVRAHVGRLRPQAPAEGGRGQTARTAVLRERVQEGVGRR